MVSTLIDEATAQKLKAIPLSDNTIARRFDKISEDMKEQLVEKTVSGLWQEHREALKDEIRIFLEEEGNDLAS
ncbi:hypothetical protein KUCAC02_002311, partial [Chaenocephalus aceratus]